MIHNLKTLFILLLLATGLPAVAQQSDEEKAAALGQQAIALMDDEHKYNEAIKLLEEAAKLDEKNINYPYEIAYALYQKADYKKTVSALQKLADRPDVLSRVYQLLGNAYDMSGSPEKAIEAYEQGLKKFPEAGELYLELGNMAMLKKNYNKALSFYENGIKKDPQFPSNYFRAALIYCNSSEEVWGMLYGEIFMNMERGTSRTADMAKVLYSIYKSEIKFTDPDNFTISFSQSADVAAGGDGAVQQPFGIGVYEQLLGLAVVGESGISLSSLNEIRTRFLDAYYEHGFDQSHPNILMDYQKKVQDAGHLEAYNYWLLGPGEDQSFNQWRANHEEAWDSFMTWFGTNKMVVDEQHKFHREQYQ